MKLGSIMNTVLGSKGFYPLPKFVKRYLRTLAPPRAMLYMSRLMNGVDLSFIADNEVGCAESVSRIGNILYDDEIITGTYTLLAHLLKYPYKWKELAGPENGCIVIAATGTGNGKIPGHTGIYDHGYVWNNNSGTGRWVKSYSIQSFKARYKLYGGMNVRYFRRLTI